MHFGINVRPGKHGLKLNKDSYAIINTKSSFTIKMSKAEYTDDTYKFYTDEWAKTYQAAILKNYDLNMKYYSLLDKDKFKKEVIGFIERYKFTEVDDLNDYKDKAGYYLMILDDYCQVYVGTCKNIYERIKNHWKRVTPFDRLLFPMWNIKKSRLSIDSFRSLDTKRLYILESDDTYSMEDKYIQYFSDEFICNRVGGGTMENVFRLITTTKERGLE